MAVRMAVRLGLEKRRRHHIAPEEHHDPVHRAHEHGLPLAPMHAARNGQLIERGLHEPRQKLDGVLTNAGADEE